MLTATLRGEVESFEGEAQLTRSLMKARTGGRES